MIQLNKMLRREYFKSVRSSLGEFKQAYASLVHIFLYTHSREGSITIRQNEILFMFSQPTVLSNFMTNKPAKALRLALIEKLL